MKKRLTPFWLLGCIFLFCCCVDAGADDWNIEKSKHFIIYYRETPRGYINKVKRRAEYYYRSITDYLGLMRFNFWTWEERCKIYLYPEREEYLEETPSVSWSRGGVHIIKKEIITYAKEEQFLDYVLPHELGHIIFREVIGFDKKIPLWIDEAVAVLQEKNRQRYLIFAKKLVKEKQYTPLEKLSKLNDYGQISPQAFYSESASIIDFLLEKFGKDEFITFCRRLRDGENWKQAMLGTYKFENLRELEEAWVNSLF